MSPYSVDGNPYGVQDAQLEVIGVLLDTLLDSATIDFTVDTTALTVSGIVIDNSITFAKIQQISTLRLLGRNTAGTGNVEQITVGGGIEFTGSTGIQRSALSGDASASAGSGTLTLATVNSNVGTFGSASQVAQLTVNGKGLVTAASNISIAITSSAVTDFNETAQDAVGNILVDSSRIDLTYSDIGNTITADLIANSVSDTYLRQGGALSVIGRSANSLGNVSDISGTNNQVLRVASSVLGFGSTLDAVTIGGTTPAAGSFTNLTATLDAGLAATKKLYLDGVALSGNSYIQESSADIVDMYSGGILALRNTIDYTQVRSVRNQNTTTLNPYYQLFDGTVTAYLELSGGVYRINSGIASSSLVQTYILGTKIDEISSSGLSITGQIVLTEHLYLGPTKRVYLDGGSNTYIYESAADILDLVSGGSVSLRALPTGAGVPHLQRLFLDGGGNTYAVETTNDIIDFVAGGSTAAQILSTGVSLGVNSTSVNTLNGYITGTGPSVAGDVSWVYRTAQSGGGAGAGAGIQLGYNNANYAGIAGQYDGIGTLELRFYTMPNSGTLTEQVRIKNTNSATNYLILTGSNGGAPKIDVSGGGILNLTPAVDMGDYVNMHAGKDIRWNGGDAAIVNSSTTLILKTYDGAALSSAWTVSASGTIYPNRTLGTTMTGGFVNIAAASGTPTGVPGITTGTPFYHDSGTDYLFVYNTSWRRIKHDASDLVAGTVSTARLGSGTASAWAGLKGDQTWKREWNNFVKPTDENKNSNTLADDADLKVTLTANTKYAFRILVFFDTTAAGDFKYRLAFTGTTTLTRFHQLDQAPAATTFNQYAIQTAMHAVDQPVLSASTTGGYVELSGILQVGASGGDLKFQWAQNTTDGANNATVRAGSFLEAISQ